MYASTTLDDARTATPADPAPRRRVTDAPTRMFHWLFALSFTGAYLTADSEHWRLMHVTLGYTFAGLLGFRVIYGLFGPRHARLRLLARRLAGGPAWLRSLVSSGSSTAVNWRQGQHLAMALAIVLMLALVIPLTLSGYATWAEWGEVLGGDWPEDVHEAAANAFLAVVIVHLALILGLGLLQRQNLAMPMITGYRAGAGASPVTDNKGWLAVLLLTAVLAFGTWQWQSSPNGLLPVTGHASAAGDFFTDEDDEWEDD